MGQPSRKVFELLTLSTDYLEKGGGIHSDRMPRCCWPIVWGLSGFGCMLTTIVPLRRKS